MGNLTQPEAVVVTFLLAGVVLFIVFYLLRAFSIWYWRIGERIKLSEKTNSLLLTLIKAVSPEEAEKIAEAEKAAEKEKKD